MPTEKVQLKTYSILTNDLKLIKDKFAQENFDIEEVNDPEWEDELKEWYWKEPDSYIFAYINNEIVGIASFFKRKVKFQENLIKMAGFGGLTVAIKHRGKGIAKKLIEERIELAKDWGADIAFLNTDINKLGNLFSKFGFVPLRRNYVFIGKSGQKHEDDSGMIAPILSNEKFREVLNHTEPFFIGDSNL